MLERLVAGLGIFGLVSLVACGPDGGGSGGTSAGGAAGQTGAAGAAPGGGGSPGGNPGAASCAQQITPNPTGGCAPRVVTPAVCAEVDLTNGQSYEVAWTTDGTGCETPWTACVAGNPVSDPNSVCVKLSENVNAGISRTGGIANIAASDLEGLTSDNGVYHLLIASFYGSHLGSVAFRVKK